MFDDVPGGAAGGFVDKDGVFNPQHTEMGLLRTGDVDPAYGRSASTSCLRTKSPEESQRLGDRGDVCLRVGGNEASRSIFRA